MSAYPTQEFNQHPLTNYYATVFLDLDGQVKTHVSPPLMEFQNEIFTADAKKRFVDYVHSSNGSSIQFGQAQPSDYYNAPPAPWQTQSGQTPLIRWDGQPEQIPSHIGQGPASSPPGDSTLQISYVQINDSRKLREFYCKAFRRFQQVNCRLLAKAYIKGIEPRKQVNYPYKGWKVVSGRRQNLGSELTKPPWWPKGIQHKEPDHLQKDERVALLVHILCDLNQSHGVTVARLQEWDAETRRHIQPADKLTVLDELYSVRKMEELYIWQKIGPETRVKITLTDISNLCKKQEI